MHLSPNHHFLSSCRDVKAICQPLQKISVNYFSYTRSYNDGKRLYFNTSPEWLYNYFYRDFHLIGNCELKPKSYQQAQTFLWSTLPKQIIYNDTRQFGIQDGLFLVNPCKNYTEFFEFSTLNRDTNMVNVYLNNVEFLQNFTRVFVQEAETIIKQSEGLELILPYRKEKQSFSEIVRVKSFNDKLCPQVKLTHQQHECAVRLLQGKSQKIIGREMGLSPRTVETYLNNLKSRLGAANRTELIIMLAQLLKYNNFIA